ncbi:MAG: NusG domain II-containing protein [Lachnospiraceae bacterium]
MKRNDWILAVTILTAALAVFLLYSLSGNERAESVTIRVDGTMYGVYDLAEDQVIEVNEANTLEIKDGQVEMIYADCPDQLCVHQQAISKNHESIICLPNKVVIEVNSSSEGELDTVSQ